MCLGELLGNSDHIATELLPPIAFSTSGLRTITVAPGIHCNHPVTVAQLLRDWSPGCGAIAIGVME
jgi:hypothetical protein